MYLLSARTAMTSQVKVKITTKSSYVRLSIIYFFMELFFVLFLPSCLVNISLCNLLLQCSTYLCDSEVHVCHISILL